MAMGVSGVCEFGERRDGMRMEREALHGHAHGIIGALAIACFHVESVAWGRLKCGVAAGARRDGESEVRLNN